MLAIEAEGASGPGLRSARSAHEATSRPRDASPPIRAMRMFMEAPGDGIPSGGQSSRSSYMRGQMREGNEQEAEDDVVALRFSFQSPATGCWKLPPGLDLESEVPAL